MAAVLPDLRPKAPHPIPSHPLLATAIPRKLYGTRDVTRSPEPKADSAPAWNHSSGAHFVDLK